MSIFAERLTELREARGIKRAVASELCGFGSNAFRRYELEEMAPSLSAAVTISDFFGVSLDYLVGRSDDR